MTSDVHRNTWGAFCIRCVSSRNSRDDRSTGSLFSVTAYLFLAIHDQGVYRIAHALSSSRIAAPGACDGSHTMNVAPSPGWLST
jgi:hypothetical protein